MVPRYTHVCRCVNGSVFKQHLAASHTSNGSGQCSFSSLESPDPHALLPAGVVQAIYIVDVNRGGGGAYNRSSQAGIAERSLSVPLREWFPI
jgi:hypothetical protein